jgi:chromate reductase, NAD(P)H dehydrogenase (quinone)
MARVSLLGLSGSLRAESYSTAILHSLADRLEGRTELGIHDYAELPLYNQDLDDPNAPAAVHALRDAIAQADGLVIVTPEYNYGMPGVLKNALDWASRPYGAASLKGKPVVTISNSPAFTGGVRALSQLHETLLATQSLIVPRFQTVIGEVHKKFEDGRLSDEAAISFALEAIDDLRAFVGQPARIAA